MKDYWSRDMKLLFWKDTCNILSTFTHSKHCYKEGDKQINLKLKLICCLDNNGGNINSKTGYHFIGNDGFWFVDENENDRRNHKIAGGHFASINELVASLL